MLEEEIVGSVTLYDHYDTVICKYELGDKKGTAAGQHLAKLMGQSCVVISKSAAGTLNSRGLYSLIHDSMTKGVACHVISDGCKRNFLVDSGFLTTQAQWEHTQDAHEARAFEESMSVKRCDIEFRKGGGAETSRVEKIEFASDTHYGLVVQRLMFEVCGFKEPNRMLYTGGRAAFLETELYFGPAVTQQEFLWTLAPGSEARHFMHVAAEQDLQQAEKLEAKADKLEAKAEKLETKAALELAAAGGASSGIAIVEPAGAAAAAAALEVEQQQAKKKWWIRMLGVAVVALLALFVLIGLGTFLFSGPKQRRRLERQSMSSRPEEEYE